MVCAGFRYLRRHQVFISFFGNRSLANKDMQWPEIHVSKSQPCFFALLPILHIYITQHMLIYLDLPHQMIDDAYPISPFRSQLINKTFFSILTHLELNMRVDTCVPVVCLAPQPEEAVDQQGPEERLVPARRGRAGTGPSCRPGGGRS